MSYLVNPYMVSASGVTYPDSLGELNLTVSDSSMLVSGGKFDNCLEFNGSSEVVVADNIYASMTTTGSVAMWINVDALSNGENFWSFGSDSDETFLRIFQDGTGGNLGAGIKVAGTWKWLAYCQAGDISASSWYSLICQHDGSLPEIFINGVASINSYGVTTDKTAWVSALTGGSVARFGVGRYDSTNNGYLAGKEDDVGIYSTAIGASLASDIYDSGTGQKISEISTANCKAYFTNDALGDTVLLPNDALPI